MRATEAAVTAKVAVPVEGSGSARGSGGGVGSRGNGVSLGGEGLHCREIFLPAFVSWTLRNALVST